jgi:hypothetical protein
VWGAWRCGRCGGVGSLLTFDIPQTALVATLDTYNFNYCLIFATLILQSDYKIFFLMKRCNLIQKDRKDIIR